ncbi:MAG: IclR family transcriptional regulator [Alphaproteobacteria bacterium]|nr:IclR family transcriptional regulator [Alphaproteobacteria bacterium]
MLHLLAALARNREGMTLADLTEHSRLPKSTVLSLLRALEGGGYVVKAQGSYTLGNEALKLGAAMVEGPRFPPSVRVALEQLAAATGESALLATLVTDEPLAVYVDVIESQATIRFTVPVGGRRPLYCTAVGLVLLAFQPQSYRDGYLRSLRPKRYTESTITDKARLEREIARIREDGVGVSLDLMIDGAGGVAAPVRNGSGAVIAVVAAGCPSARLIAKRDHLIACTRRCADEISALLGYSGA